MQHSVQRENVPRGAQAGAQEVAISVIVPAYNSEETLADCLKSIQANTYPHLAIYVVDDCSTDRTREVAESFDCTLLQTERNLGPGHARNLGARHARTPLLLFVDSDCVVPPDWASRYVVLFSGHPDVACICSGYSENLTRGFWAQFQFLDTKYNQKFTPEHPRWASSCNFSCKREAFWSVRGFPEIYFNEDMEFFFFLTAKHRLLWRPDLGVSHHFHASLWRYVKQQYSWARSVVETYLRHPEIFLSQGTISAGNISLQIILLGVMFVALVLWGYTGQPVGFLAALVAACGHLAANAGFFRFTKQSAGLSFALKSMAAALLRNAIWSLGMAHGALTYAHRWPPFLGHWLRRTKQRPRCAT